jgi:hypothetical protein
MEFLKQLEEDGRSKLSDAIFDDDSILRGFKHIQIGDLSLSIQASWGHYCTPRRTLNNLDEYSTMEFAIIQDDGEFATVSEVLPTFSRLDEIEEYENTVYGYVPVDLIEQLYQELISH